MRLVLGQCVITPAALDALRRNQDNSLRYLLRHSRGDWGEISEDDARTNAESVAASGGAMSVYKLADNTIIWVISDTAQGPTTLLLPDDY